VFHAWSLLSSSGGSVPGLVSTPVSFQSFTIFTSGDCLGNYHGRVKVVRPASFQALPARSHSTMQFYVMVSTFGSRQPLSAA